MPNQSQGELDTIEKVLDLVQRDYVNGEPLFLANPDQSCFAVLHFEDKRVEIEHSQALELITEKNVLMVTQSTPKEGYTFYHAVKQHFGDINAPRSIQGVYSISDVLLFTFVDKSADQSVDSFFFADRIKQGTLKQVIEATKVPDDRGKILNALDIPLSHLGVSFSSFSTDSYALQATSGDWKYTFPPSLADIVWGLAATKDAFHDVHIDANGFCTGIIPLFGEKLWIIMHPRHPGLDLTNRQLFINGKLSLDSPTHHKDWIYEAVLLDRHTEL